MKYVRNVQSSVATILNNNSFSSPHCSWDFMIMMTLRWLQSLLPVEDDFVVYQCYTERMSVHHTGDSLLMACIGQRLVV